MGVLQPPFSLVSPHGTTVGRRATLGNLFAIAKHLLKGLHLRSLLCMPERRAEIAQSQRLENPSFAEVSDGFCSRPRFLAMVWRLNAFLDTRWVNEAARRATSMGELVHRML